VARKEPSACPQGNEGHPGFFRLNVQAGQLLWRLQFRCGITWSVRHAVGMRRPGTLDTDSSDPCGQSAGTMASASALVPQPEPVGN
jgi:hypothetical protein